MFSMTLECEHYRHRTHIADHRLEVINAYLLKSSLDSKYAPPPFILENGFPAGVDHPMMEVVNFHHIHGSHVRWDEADRVYCSCEEALCPCLCTCGISEDYNDKMRMKKELEKKYLPM